MPKHSLPLIWQKNRSKEEIAAIRHTFETNRAFIDHLLELIDSMYALEDTQIDSLKDYESPGYPYLRSNRDGARRALKAVKQLFTNHSHGDNSGK